MSLKVGELEMPDMVDVLSRVSRLQELGAGSYAYLMDEGGEDENVVSILLPQRLESLSGMWSLTDVGLPMILPLAPNLKKLDLRYTLLTGEGQCMLLSCCHSLEEFQVPHLSQQLHYFVVISRLFSKWHSVSWTDTKHTRR